MWLQWALGACVAGVALVLILVALVPSRIVIPVGRPGGLVPPMLIGVHGAEKNYDHWMRWTTGHARVRWPGRFGAVPEAIVVTVAGFPGRAADQVEIRINGVPSRHQVTARYEDLRIPVPHGVRAPLDVTITSPVTRPPADPRTLGVRLEAVTIENRDLASRVADIDTPGGVLVLGALAWLIGVWAAGHGAPAYRRIACGAAAWALVVLAMAVVSATALRPSAWLTLGPVAVGGLATWLLARAGQARVAAALSGLALTLLGLTIVTWCVASFVDVPRWDIWDFVVFLGRREQRGLTLADFWAPHNEHRPSVIRAVLLANVLLSGWNHWNELWTMLVITAVHALLLVKSVGDSRQRSGVATLIFVAGAGTLVATATQWENWLQGWQIALVNGAACMSAALILLAGRAITWPRLTAAAALVFLGTAGFASCLAGWPIGLVAILVRRPRQWPAKAAAWLAVGVLVSLAYVHGMVRPPELPAPAPIFSSLEALWSVTYGTLLALGLPIWYEPHAFLRETFGVWLMPAVGAGGILLGVVVLFGHWRDVESRREQAWLLPALLMAFSGAACTITAIGRVPMGLHAMTASRYIVFTVLFWIGLLMLLTVRTPYRSRAARGAGLVVASLIVAGGLRAWGDALPFMEQHYVGGILGREALLRADWPNTGALFPVAPVLDERRQWLERHHLSLYRPARR
ncbi:hypothetical protein LuPra_04620 [Luteitalea pratensis]|uniref:Uncharacterized protein n=1 Tax=Luteitalea pratensis TaxID=1855912 RepID=A0A143PTF5_LUTPR|nr:hypothetical protein [Luteitalea pratensis]AMY11370.1 hypothetical protein LuPra_04620 [Luteitalea pratensis]